MCVRKKFLDLYDGRSHQLSEPEKKLFIVHPNMTLLLAAAGNPLAQRLRATFAISWWDIIDLTIRASIVYIVLLAGIRITGKREVGQMTPFDLVLLLLISNAVQNSMIGPYNALTAGLVAAFVLLLVNRGLSRLSFKDHKWRQRIEGSPSLLVYQGRVNQRAMTREGISEEDLRTALREHGVEHVGEVHMAVLEVDGNISVIREDERPTTHRPHHQFRFLKKKN